MMDMRYEVKVLRKARKDIEKSPSFIKARFVNLVRDLQSFGPYSAANCLPLKHPMTMFMSRSKVLTGLPPLLRM